MAPFLSGNAATFSRVALVGTVVLVVACTALMTFAGKDVPAIPLGLPGWTGGAVDAESSRLGQQLFFDARLSADGKMSCATCHDPRQGFTQNDRATPVGRDGRPLRRNASTLLNVVYAAPLMHDGAAPSLESQALTPLLDGNEMGNADFVDIERRLAAIPEYAAAFRVVFGEGPGMAHVGSALAAYQRTLVSGNSPFDRWRYGGHADALSRSAQRGFALFSGKAGCTSCHLVGATAALFSDNRMHNTGTAVQSDRLFGVKVASRTSGTIDFAAAGDRGRHEVTQDPADLYRFRTPTLRNITQTAPYMHDGGMASLDDVVRFYNAGGGANANLDPAIKPLGLNEGEIADLVAFLNSLTGDNVEDLKSFAAPVSAPASP